MGHGNHWAAILGDGEDAIGRMLAKTTEKGAVLGGKVEKASPDRPKVWNALTYPGTPLQYLVLLETTQERNVLMNGYPYAPGGVRNRLKVERIHGSEVNGEALIEASFEDAVDITFFDPLYFREGHRYAEGQTYDFELSAIAYRIRRAEPQVFTVDRPELAAILGAPGDESRGPVAIHTEGAAILLPIEQGEPDDYQFQAPIEAVSSFKIEGTRIYRARATLLRLDAPFVVDLYAAEHVLPSGYEPREGDDVTGVLWLQGHLVGA